MKRFSVLLLALALTASAGCADEFDDYNQVLGFRLLGLGADGPALAPGETTSLSALVTETEATYEWTWCPLSSGAADSFRCAIEHAEMQAATDEVFGAGVVTIPPFELGTDASVDFVYSMPGELFEGLCQILLMQDLPPGVDAPLCQGQFDVQVRLVARSSAEEIIGVRDVGLLFDDTTPANQNPNIESVVVREPGGDEIALAQDMPTTLRRGIVYQVELGIPEASSETYLDTPIDGPPEEVREDLTVSWFYEAGAFDKSRSAFLDGTVAFETLRANEYTTPLSDEHPDDSLRLYFVLRDERGGMSWAVREIALETP